MRKKIIACIMALAIAVAFMPTSAFAASKVKMKVYDQVYKTGNTAYCAGGQGLYKVTLKNGAVTSKKLIFAPAEVCKGPSVFAMHKKGKYIYFLELEDIEGDIFSHLDRVSTSGKKVKYLYPYVTKYAIKGKKIYFGYYDYRDPWSGKEKKGVMKLNGKKSKKTSKKVKMKRVKSNKTGYSMKVVTKKYSEKKQEETDMWGYNYDYLKTPSGTYYLGGAEIDW